MSSSPKTPNLNGNSRREILGLAAAAPILLGATALAPAKAAALTPVRISWLPGATCVAPLPLGVAKGIFAKHGLDVQLVDYDFHTQAFLESPTNGGADAAVTMVGNWLPQIQRGLPVKILTGVHAGCVRLLGSRKAGVTRLADLKGKTIAAGGPPKLAREVYSVMLTLNGIDPNDISWLEMKTSEVGAAFEAGKAQAVGSIDPWNIVLQRNYPDLVEILSNDSGLFKDKGCCMLAAGDALLKDRPLVAASLVVALNEASDYTHAHPEEAAAQFAKRSPFSQADVLESLKRTGFHAHHRNMDLRGDLVFYVQAYKEAGLFPADLDVKALVDRAYAPVVC